MRSFDLRSPYDIEQLCVDLYLLLTYELYQNQLLLHHDQRYQVQCQGY